MKSLVLIIVLSSTSLTELSSDQATVTVDCKAERIALLESIKPTVDPRATLDTPQDSDPATIQFLVIKDMPIIDSHISDNGQVIYVSEEGLIGENADPKFGARLFSKAVDRLLELKIGPVCPPIEI